MPTFLITYDLNTPGQRYNALYEHLKSYRTWWHHLDSTWMVVTSGTTAQVRDAMKPYLDVNDKVLVIDVTADPAAWRGINESGSDWLHKHL